MFLKLKKTLRIFLVVGTLANTVVFSTVAAHACSRVEYQGKQEMPLKILSRQSLFNS